MTIANTTANPTAPESSRKISPFEAQCRRRGFPDRHIQNLAASLNPCCEAHRQAFRRAQELFARPGAILLFTGLRGTGKTQMAVDLVAPAIEGCQNQPEARWPRYVKISDMFREIRQSFNRESLVSEMEVVATYRRPSVLVIDEAQERSESAFEDKTLTHIFDIRYDALRSTILISNLKREELAKTLGPSIVSRLHECGDVIECTWESFRERRDGA